MCNTDLQNMWMYFAVWAIQNNQGDQIYQPALIKRSTQDDMILFFKHLPSYSNCMLSENVRSQNHVGKTHDYQLYGKHSTNFFYFRTIKVWNVQARLPIARKAPNEFLLLWNDQNVECTPKRHCAHDLSKKKLDEATIRGIGLPENL